MPIENDQEQLIRERAYRLWQEEGEPEGRAEIHWEMAQRDINPGAGLRETEGAKSDLVDPGRGTYGSAPASDGELPEGLQRGRTRPLGGGRDRESASSADRDA